MSRMNNIVLTGFMGTGKTAVGTELARLTGYRTVDVDAEIERAVGMTISKIFERSGEPGFRDMETGQIRRLSGERNLIIATGGGAVLREENMQALRSGGVVFCLTASPETILRRTSMSDERPLLQVDDPMKKIRELLEARRPHYEKADFMIDTEGKTPREVAQEILDRIGWKR